MKPSVSDMEEDFHSIVTGTTKKGGRKRRVYNGLKETVTEISLDGSRSCN